ncbi:hypothetical protein T484DRAFT_1794665 [Baffinella frigidus]|nr:hypothetical protein T484DRAFT_1794665 [Cryptophyta sp. CCMP2293]
MPLRGVGGAARVGGAEHSLPWQGALATAAVRGGAFAGGGGDQHDGSASFASESLDLESVASEGLGFLEGEGGGAEHEEEERALGGVLWLGFLEGEGGGAEHEEEERLHMESVRLLASELGKVERGGRGGGEGLEARERTLEEKRNYATRLLEEKRSLGLEARERTLEEKRNYATRLLEEKRSLKRNYATRLLEEKRSLVS